MSSVAETEAAIERLSPAEVNQIAARLDARRQQALNAFAKTSANATTITMRGAAGK